jgi:hypothetical protein
LGDQFVNDIDPLEDFRSDYYRRYNHRRLEHLASLRLDLFGKDVIELGAGIGDLSTFFLDRACSVMSLEPRPENVSTMLKIRQHIAATGYQEAARWQIVHAGVDEIDGFRPFDVVFCYGLLYHLRDPLKALQLMAKCCSDMAIIETCVSMDRSESLVVAEEPEDRPSQSIQLVGCRPSRLWLFNRLRELFQYVYVPSIQPSHEEAPLDWTLPSRMPNSRAVFIASRRKLDNPLLLDHLPDRQQAI